jgi:AcrR family transcriptional regulator
MNINKKEKYHADDLKASIVDVATTILIDDGIEAVTMRSIASKLAVSRGAPYRHFEGKHDLLCSVAQNSFEMLNTSMLNLNPTGGGPKGELFQLTYTYIDFCLSFPALYHLIFNNADLSNNQTKELSNAAYKLFHQLESLLTKFQQEYIIKKEDINLQANFVWSSLHGYCCLLLTQETGKVEKLVINKAFFLEKIWDALLNQR